MDRQNNLYLYFLDCSKNEDSTGLFRTAPFYKRTLDLSTKSYVFLE